VEIEGINLTEQIKLARRNLNKLYHRELSVIMRKYDEQNRKNSATDSLTALNQGSNEGTMKEGSEELDEGKSGGQKEQNEEVKVEEKGNVDGEGVCICQKSTMLGARSYKDRLGLLAVKAPIRCPCVKDLGIENDRSYKLFPRFSTCFKLIKMNEFINKQIYFPSMLNQNGKTVAASFKKECSF
jgi:hypothetical protein